MKTMNGEPGTKGSQELTGLNPHHSHYKPAHKNSEGQKVILFTATRNCKKNYVGGDTAEKQQ